MKFDVSIDTIPEELWRWPLCWSQM